jgi:hypothetical protein
VTDKQRIDRLVIVVTVLTFIVTVLCVQAVLP